MPEPAPDSDVRRKVMNAALALFCEQTWEGTRVPEIAERAGVSVGTIYRYFPSKEALGSAVFSEAKAALTALTLTDEVRRAEPVEALRGIWDGLLRFATEQPDAFAFLEHQQHATFLTAEAVALVDDYQAEFARILQAGQRTGVVWEGDPAVLGALSFGALVGLTKLARAGGVGIDAFDLVMVERAVGAVLGMPAPEPR